MRRLCIHLLIQRFKSRIIGIFRSEFVFILCNFGFFFVCFAQREVSVLLLYEEEVVIFLGVDGATLGRKSSLAQRALYGSLDLVHLPDSRPKVELLDIDAVAALVHVLADDLLSGLQKPLDLPLQVFLLFLEFEAPRPLLELLGAQFLAEYLIPFDVSGLLAEVEGQLIDALTRLFVSLALLCLHAFDHFVYLLLQCLVLLGKLLDFRDQFGVHSTELVKAGPQIRLTMAGCR